MIYGTRIGMRLEFLFPSFSWFWKWEWWMFQCLIRIKNQFVLILSCLWNKKSWEIAKQIVKCCFLHLTLSLTHNLWIHEDEIHLCNTWWLWLFSTFPGLGWKNDLWIGLDFIHCHFFGRWQHMRSFYTALITVKSFTDTNLESQDRAYLTQNCVKETTGKPTNPLS